MVDSTLREMVPISQEQWSFTPERPTKRKSFNLAFLDLEMAYDRQLSTVLSKSLRVRSVPKSLITVIKGTCGGSKAAIRFHTG